MARTAPAPLAAAAVQRKGALRARKWLLLRRLTQGSVLGLFLLGPLAGIWLIKGSLSASLILDTLPLTDPYVLLQGLLAGHLAEVSGVLGAAIVLSVYLLAGGRAYCAWCVPSTR